MLKARITDGILRARIKMTETSGTNDESAGKRVKVALSNQETQTDIDDSVAQQLEENSKTIATLLRNQQKQEKRTSCRRKKGL